LDADFPTAFFAAAAQNSAAPDRFHATAKTMNLLAFTFVGLIGSFHKRKTIPFKTGSTGEPFLVRRVGEKSADFILYILKRST
jgi:hypothetical protein